MMVRLSSESHQSTTTNPFNNKTVPRPPNPCCARKRSNDGSCCHNDSQVSQWFMSPITIQVEYSLINSRVMHWLTSPTSTHESYSDSFTSLANDSFTSSTMTHLRVLQTNHSRVSQRLTHESPRDALMNLAALTHESNKDSTTSLTVTHESCIDSWFPHRLLRCHMNYQSSPLQVNFIQFLFI